MFRFLTWPVRYGFGLAFSLGLAAVPWVMMMLYSPLPPDLRVTATALSATRTAREAPQIVSEQAKAQPGSILSMEATQTSGPALLSTATVTPRPTQTRTPMPTFTPAPVVSGITNETVNAYRCPGRDNRLGNLEKGSMFTILGWDETEEFEEITTWLLIENDLDKPQKWIKDSEYLLLGFPEYKTLIPRLACRR